METTKKINFISSLVKEVIETMEEEYGFLSTQEQGTSNLNQAYLYQVIEILGKIEQ